ncbi:unnamed protein product [Lampetra fluviatilis]
MCSEAWACFTLDEPRGCRKRPTAALALFRAWVVEAATVVAKSHGLPECGRAHQRGGARWGPPRHQHQLQQHLLRFKQRLLSRQEEAGVVEEVVLRVTGTRILERRALGKRDLGHSEGGGISTACAWALRF